MQGSISEIVKSPLFEGIEEENHRAMLGCVSYHIVSYQKGETIALEEDQIKHIGIVLKGAVDMVKEDLWGNKTLLMRTGEHELFGESFACGSDTLSSVIFVAAENAEICFIPFRNVMHSCTMACEFHHRLIENMVRLIADKNRDLMRKIEVISKRTLREKIMAYLSWQAQIQGKSYFELPLGRGELADYLCADRSALTRELSNMRAEGLIDYDKNLFRIF